MDISGNYNLQDKVAIITGASKGIGEAMARGLAANGAKVIVSSRKQDAVDKVASEIKSSGGEATGIECHVGKREHMDQLIAKTVELYGGVDILINNAAINPFFGPITDTSEEVFDKVMDVNVKSCMILGNLCHPIMKERGGGSVINIASVEGLKPSTGLGIYSVSKAAVVMLTKSQAKEWGRDNIRSNAICPGLIQTKLSAALWQDENALAKFSKFIPMKRIAQPEELVGLALYLSSSVSSYTTGGVYTADGGYMVG